MFHLAFYAAQEKGADCAYFPSLENSCPNASNREVVARPMFSVEFTKCNMFVSL
jgi:hypothetical protein